MVLSSDDQPSPRDRKGFGKSIIDVNAADLKMPGFGGSSHKFYRLAGVSERRVRRGLAEAGDSLFLRNSPAHSAFKSSPQVDSIPRSVPKKAQFQNQRALAGCLLLRSPLFEIAFYDGTMPGADGAFPGFVA